MGRPCSTCTHPKRREIDRALAERQPYRRLAAIFRVSERSLRRHLAGGHILKALDLRARQQERVDALDIVARFVEVDRVVGDVLDHAVKTGNVRLALEANRAARENVIGWFRVQGDLDFGRSDEVWTVEFERSP
jgi:DNA-binding transcriptional ArsR family regulator